MSLDRSLADGTRHPLPGESAGAPTARTPDWRMRTPADAEQARTLADRARTGLPIAYIEHDVEWAALKRDVPGEELLVLSDEEADRIVGIAPFQVYPTHLEYGFGPIRILRKRVRCIHLELEPIVARPNSRDAMVNCFEALCQLIPGDSAVYCECVPEHSILYELLEDRGSALHRFFHVLPWGPVSPRYKIAWDGTFERYLTSIGHTSRKDLRRTLKKFEQRHGNAFELRRYQAEDEVSAFLQDAIPISDLTYQKQKLGIGLSDDDRLEIKLKAAARKGYFLGHNLYVDGKAVAFHYGFNYASTFFMIDGGYDPVWSKSQIGVVIFCEMLKDIEKCGDRIALMDYMNGRNALKERTSNVVSAERNYYLFRRTVVGSIYYSSLKSMNRASDSITRFLGRLNLADRTKTLVRNWTGRGHI